MFVPQPEACRPTFAFGAYLRTIAIMQRPRPAMLFSWVRAVRRVGRLHGRRLGVRVAVGLLAVAPEVGLDVEERRRGADLLEQEAPVVQVPRQEGGVVHRRALGRALLHPARLEHLVEREHGDLGVRLGRGAEARHELARRLGNVLPAAPPVAARGVVAARGAVHRAVRRARRAYPGAPVGEPAADVLVAAVEGRELGGRVRHGGADEDVLGAEVGEERGGEAGRAAARAGGAARVVVLLLPVVVLPVVVAARWRCRPWWRRRRRRGGGDVLAGATRAGRPTPAGAAAPAPAGDEGNRGDEDQASRVHHEGEDRAGVTLREARCSRSR